MRFVINDVNGQSALFGSSNVRWIRYDDVDPPLQGRRDRIEIRALNHRHGQCQTFDVPSRPGQRVSRLFRCVDARIRSLMRDGKSDGPGTCPNVYNGAPLREKLHRASRYDLGLRTRDEHSRPHLKVYLPEPGNTHDVLKRFSGKPPFDEGLSSVHLIRR